MLYRKSCDRRLRLFGTYTVCVLIADQLKMESSDYTGDRALSVAGPRAWNALPADIRCAPSLDTVKKRLKLHLFSAAYRLTFDIPRMRTRMGDRALSVAGPRAWNALPADIRCAPSLDTFKKRLKTHLFSAAYKL